MYVKCIVCKKPLQFTILSTNEQAYLHNLTDLATQAITVNYHFFDQTVRLLHFMLHVSVRLQEQQLAP